MKSLQNQPLSRDFVSALRYHQLVVLVMTGITVFVKNVIILTRFLGKSGTKLTFEPPICKS
jgi:hypothetical protein